MAEIHVMAERSISAPAADVYRYLADYQDHHPHFLPPAFSGVAVESGGVGAGTVLRFGLRLGGRTRAYRQAVTEPEPGRVLRETGLVTGEVTTFTVAPQGVACRVRSRRALGARAACRASSSAWRRRASCGGCTATSSSGWTATRRSRQRHRPRCPRAGARP